MFRYLQKVLFITSSGRKQLCLILFVFIVSSLLEAFGISLVGPFLSIVSDPGRVHENSLSSSFFDFFGAQTDQSVVLVSGIFLILVFFMKTALYFASKVYVTWFSFFQKSALEVRLIDSYLKLPYEFHLQTNSAEIMQNIVSGSNQFAVNCLNPLLEIISASIVSFFLLFVLAKTDIFFLVLMLLVFLPIALSVTYLSKRQKRWGKAQTISQKDVIKSVNHALGGLKETKVIGCESYFRQGLSKHSKKFSHFATLSGSAQIAPRILIEGMILVLVIVYILIAYLLRGEGIEEVISIMSIFAVASIRLIPASSQISQAVIRLQNKSYLIDLIYADLKRVENYRSRYSRHLSRPKESLSTGEFFASPASKQSDFVSIENLSFTYPNAPRAAIENLSIAINKGESVALIGKSGSGKTTLVDILLGLLYPQSGDIKSNGISIYNDLNIWRKRVGYIPQSIFLLDDTIENNIAYGVSPDQIDEQKLMHSIKAAQLECVVASLPKGLKTFVGERGGRLSGGQRQRVGIARALYHDCEVLILDEATSALDNETETLISDAINALAGSKTLIIIAHRYSSIRHCDVIYKLEYGKVIEAGSYEEVVLSGNVGNV